MANERLPDDPITIWQNQSVEPIRMSANELRRKARQYQWKIRRRNAIEYTAALSVSVFFLFVIWKFPDALTRFGAAVSIAGMLYVVYQIYTRGSARSVPADMALKTCLDFHRRELERQRDLVGSVWSWYLGPMIPGLAILVVALGRLNPGRLPHPWRFVAAYSVLAALVFFLVGRMNRRCARRLQRQIDELNALEKQS